MWGRGAGRAFAGGREKVRIYIGTVLFGEREVERVREESEVDGGAGSRRDAEDGRGRGWVRERG